MPIKRKLKGTAGLEYSIKATPLVMPHAFSSRYPEPVMTDYKTNEQSSEARPPPAATVEKSITPLSWPETIRSGLLAGLGVQSSRNRERDFRQGSFWRFVAVGAVLTATFVLSLVLLVKVLVN